MCDDDRIKWAVCVCLCVFARQGFKGLSSSPTFLSADSMTESELDAHSTTASFCHPQPPFYITVSTLFHFITTQTLSLLPPPPPHHDIRADSWVIG